ncbi:MAG: choice-of-anchor D domain-containing protein [Deltaproteobacteria bacterium]|nr:choice-of-anchor D domain-containing protein [Deltaproteobacteria bacterium]
MRLQRIIGLSSILAVTACDCDGGGDLSAVRPKLLVTPTQLDFGDVALGERRTSSLKLTNQAEGVLTIAGLDVDTSSGAFELESGKPTSVPPNGSVDLVLAFLPSVPAASFGSLTIASNDPDQPSLLVPIRGRGILSRVSIKTPAPSCSGESLSTSAGQVAVGDTVERRIQIESRGDSPVRVLGVSLEDSTSPEWSLEAAPVEGTEIPPGLNLELVARFSPADLGPERATLVIRTDASNRPESRIALCGEGAEVALCASPSPLSLGRVPLGHAASATLELENCGGLDTELVDVSFAETPAPAPGFSMTAPSLPRALRPLASVEARIHFTPTVFGPAEAFVKAEVSPGRSVLVPVSAIGVEDCQLSAFPGRLTFGTVLTGQSAERTALLANLGSKNCTLASLSATSTAGFSVVSAHSLPKILGPGESEPVRIQYSPRAAGLPEEGILLAETGAGPVTVDLVGNTEAAGDCDLEASPAFFNFGLVARGESSYVTIQLKNVSEALCDVYDVLLDTSSDPGFGNLLAFPRRLGPGESTPVTLEYRPFRIGAASGLVSVRSSDADTPELGVPVFGASPSPSICVDPRNLDFGSVEQPTTRTVNLIGCGSQRTTVTDLVFSIPDQEFSFVAPPVLPFDLDPGQTHALEVRYSPADAVGDTAQLAVGSDDPAEPIVYVAITGGPSIVPVEAGRYLYYWEIPNNGSGDIVRMPLQGAQIPQPYWGSRTGRACAGCHTISSDGRYLAVIGEGNFELRVVDTEFDVEVVLPFQASNANFITWRPNPNSNPPYQFIYSDGDRLHVGSVFGGYLGELPGANDPTRGQKMATWGPNGVIAFVRGEIGGGFGFWGPCDIMMIDERGGVPVPLAGASGNGAANYYPQFSPDGNWLVYAYSPSAQGTMSSMDGHIQLVASDQSGNVLTLPNLNGEAGATNSFPNWSKDGRFISFASKRDASLARSWDIFFAPIDPSTGVDGPAIPLPGVNTDGFEHAAQWSP